MYQLTAVVVVPALGVLYGLVMGGEAGAIAGVAGGLGIGLFLPYVGSGPEDRIEELEREVEELRRAREADG
ncbi:hypothetical protein BRC63_08675 [Halobacteriales archaeon QH_10_70_21]|nr:MAG: hypothetical protein BRC63_08675 [Halobacteriales archaeon QH_10_70_21]